MVTKNISIRDYARSDRPYHAALRFGAVALLWLASGGLTVHAQSQFDEDGENTVKQWQETAVQLPDAPRPENLLPFFVSATASQSFAIDAKSISVGTDGVIRYTLVATSPAGAKNISYEGIRCETYERKLYAFGQPDGSWMRARRDQWERIISIAANRQHAALFKDYFCREKTVSGNADDIVRRIRYGKTLTQQDAR